MMASSISSSQGTYINFCKRNSAQKNAYTKSCYALFIVKTLIFDSRFKDCLINVTALIQAHQREFRCNEDIIFPMERELEVIWVSIDERSDAYTVGTNATTTAPTKIINAYDKWLSIHTVHTASIKVVGHRDKKCPYEKNRIPRHDKLVTTAKISMHVVEKDTVSHTLFFCYDTAKHHIC